jgi:hypothetical protein
MFWRSSSVQSGWLHRRVFIVPCIPLRGRQYQEEERALFLYLLHHIVCSSTSIATVPVRRYKAGGPVKSSDRFARALLGLGVLESFLFAHWL